MFKKCSLLTSIIITESVTEIERRAFYGYSSLNNVYCKAMSAPENNADFVFIIYIPMKSVGNYKAADD